MPQSHARRHNSRMSGYSVPCDISTFFFILQVAKLTETRLSMKKATP